MERDCANLIVNEYRITGYKDGQLTSWYAHGANPDDCLCNDWIKALKIVKIEFVKRI